MNKSYKILLLEHDPNDIEFITRTIKKSFPNYIYHNAKNEAEYLEALNNFNPDIILSDFNLVNFTAEDALRHKLEIAPYIPFIVISGTIGEERAVSLIKSGVTDYVFKGNLISLPQKITRAIKETEEKVHKLEMQKNLEASESQLARAQQLAHIGSWEIKFSSGLIHLSDEACRIYGIANDRRVLPYEDWLTLIHPVDLPTIQQRIEDKKKVDADVILFYRILRSDGRIRQAYSEAKHICDATGKSVGLYGFVQDITEKKYTEEALKQSEATLRTIFDTAEVGLILMDKNFNITTFNQNFGKWYKDIFGEALVKGLNLNKKLISAGSPGFSDRIKGTLEGAEVS